MPSGENLLKSNDYAQTFNPDTRYQWRNFYESLYRAHSRLAGNGCAMQLSYPQC